MKIETLSPSETLNEFSNDLLHPNELPMNLKSSDTTCYALIPLVAL